MPTASLATALIVDDSLTVRMDLASAFETAGFRAVCCSTAREAYETLTTQAVDIVILDVVLPDSTGPELLKRIRSGSEPQLPVLMLSSEAEVRDRMQGLAAGADEYVGKPYDATYVTAKARELVNARRTRRLPAPVLLVDASATSSKQFEAALTAQGFRVLVVHSAEEALRLASHQVPAAFIVDSTIEGTTSSNLIRRARLDAALRSVPCILLTSGVDTDAELRALEAGADASVRRDTGAAVLLAKLQALLRGAPRDEAGSELASVSAPKRILAVDDSATFRMELVDSLQGEGYDVVQARGGEEALQLISVQPVDCILLDMVMPGLGGEETCRRLKAIPSCRDIPVLLLTALEDGEALLAGLSAGADDFIQKSSGFEVLKARVRAQLRRRQIEEETHQLRERSLKSEMEAAEARASRELAETRAKLVDELQRKNQELEALAESRAELAAGLQRANTELQSAYQTLQSTQAQLVQSAKMASLGELVAGVAHEINNPLAFVISHLETVEKRLRKLTPPSSEVEQGHLALVFTRIAETRDGLHRIRDLVVKLRTFSRLDEGDFKVVSIKECIDAVLTIQRYRLGEDIRVSIEVDTADNVACYPSLITQAVMNLVSNAADAIVGTGSIAIRAGRMGETYEIVVEDSGTGIPPELRERVIEPFFTTKPVGTGTGLGLAITYSIVKKHAGELILAERPEGGTRAVIRFPYHANLA